MSMCFEINGNPSSYSNGDREARWKRRVKQRVDDLRSNGQKLPDPKKVVFDVFLKFYLFKKRFYGRSRSGGNDLDNLTKCLIDALFGKNGALFGDGDDHDPKIVLLLLEKVPVDYEKDEKAIVHINWQPQS
jgi:hypothetical protein